MKRRWKSGQKAGSSRYGSMPENGLAIGSPRTGSATHITSRSRRDVQELSAAPHFFQRTHDACVMNRSIDANDTAALVANRGVSCAGNVANVASPIRKTLKSFDRFL